jgi:hypothetical protein
MHSLKPCIEQCFFGRQPFENKWSRHNTSELKMKQNYMKIAEIPNKEGEELKVES